MGRACLEGWEELVFLGSRSLERKEAVAGRMSWKNEDRVHGFVVQPLAALAAPGQHQTSPSGRGVVRSTSFFGMVVLPGAVKDAGT